MRKHLGSTPLYSLNRPTHYREQRYNNRYSG